jgi:hypothetical protein
VGIENTFIVSHWMDLARALRSGDTFFKEHRYSLLSQRVTPQRAVICFVQLSADTTVFSAVPIGTEYLAGDHQ